MSNVTWRSRTTKRQPDQYPAPTNAILPTSRGWPRALTSAENTNAEEILSDCVFRIDALDHQNANPGTVTGTAGGGMNIKTVRNLGTAGDVLNVRTGSTSVPDTNDPMFLGWGGQNYVYTPGVAGNYLSTPSTSALSITGDIDVRAYIAPDNWIPSSNQAILAKRANDTTGFSYTLSLVGGTGALLFSTSPDGGTTNQVSKSSTATISAANGSPLWVRATLSVNNGAGGNDTKFYTSTDGTNWTQLGTTVTASGTTSINANTSSVEIGARNGGTLGQFAGKIYRAQIYNGINGTLVFDLDTSTLTSGADPYIVPLTGAGGAYFTGSGLSLPGATGNYATSPDATILRITSNIDIRVKAALTTWTPAANSSLISKYNATGNLRSYDFYVDTAGKLHLAWSTDGTSTNLIDSASSVATGLSAGATKWVRATLNTAANYTVNFYTSDDGTTWTQLGIQQGGLGSTSIYSGTAQIEIGSRSSGTQLNAGTIYRAQILNGINGTTVFDADFSTVPSTAVRMTESAAGAVVSLTSTGLVTINRSTGNGRKTVAVTAPCWLFGTDDFMTMDYSATGTKVLDFAGLDSFSVLAVFRFWGQTASVQSIYFKYPTHTDVQLPGYWLNTSTTQMNADRGDGTIRLVRIQANGPTNGALSIISTVDNRSASIRTLYSGTTSLGSVSLSGFGSSFNSGVFYIGRSTSSVQYQGMELLDIAVWRRALSAAEISTLNTYFQSRWP